MVELDIRRRRRTRRVRPRRAKPRRRRYFPRLRRVKHTLMSKLNKIIFGVSVVGAGALAVVDTDREYNLSVGNKYGANLFMKDFMNNVTLSRPVYITSADPEHLVFGGLLNKYSIAGIVSYTIGWILGKFLKFKGISILKTLGKGLTVGGMIGGLFNLAPAEHQGGGGGGGGGGGTTGMKMFGGEPTAQVTPSPTVVYQGPKVFGKPAEGFSGFRKYIIA